jgi:hypothetical protein
LSYILIINRGHCLTIRKIIYQKYSYINFLIVGKEYVVIYKKMDSESLDRIIRKEPTDLITLLRRLFVHIHVAIAIILFIIFILINSTGFVSTVLANVPDAVSGIYPTEKGLIIQGVIISVSYMILQFFRDLDLL